MDKDLKTNIALASLVLAIGMGALALYAKQNKDPELEPVPVLEEEVPVLPLNGEFYCEFYKTKTQVMEGIAGYEVTEGSRGWNWVFHMHDGTSIFYVQLPGQFCYVHHVEEE